MLVRVLVAALVALVTATSLTVVTQYKAAERPLQTSQDHVAQPSDSQIREAQAEPRADMPHERAVEAPDILSGNK